MAAAGISGRRGRKPIVAQNNACNAAYNQNELARQNALQNIDNQIANAYASAGAQGERAKIFAAAGKTHSKISLRAGTDAQNAINGLFNYAGVTGNIGGCPTLSAQELAANNAYNNALSGNKPTADEPELLMLPITGDGSGEPVLYRVPQFGESGASRIVAAMAQRRNLYLKQEAGNTASILLATEGIYGKKPF